MIKRKLQMRKKGSNEEAKGRLNKKMGEEKVDDEEGNRKDERENEGGVIGRRGVERRGSLEGKERDGKEKGKETKCRRRRE